MMRQLKKYLIWAIAWGALYFIMSHHFIIVGRSVNMLRKSKLSLNYTIFSTKGMSAKAILSIPELREDGIGELLVETGRMTEEQLELMLDQMREKEEARENR